MRYALYSPLVDLQVTSLALGVSLADHEHENGVSAAITLAGCRDSIARARAALDAIEAALPADLREAA